MIHTNNQISFGYLPAALDFTVGVISINTLPSLDDTIRDVEAAASIEEGWLYAPLVQKRDFSTGNVLTLPYPHRIFGLPKTHVIQHENWANEDHATFHLWALSFFLGIRLTATEAGFVDATPHKSGKLVDFNLCQKSLEEAVKLAEHFWIANLNDPHRARVFGAAVHALFLSQCPRFLQFEEFMMLYNSLDACFKLASLLRPVTQRPSHAKRVSWMCQEFQIAEPVWASVQVGAHESELSRLRNFAVHEALFMDEPLGFGIHGIGTTQNLTLEMRKLICRLLVAMIGGTDATYLMSAVDDRQKRGLTIY